MSGREDRRHPLRRDKDRSAEQFFWSLETRYVRYVLNLFKMGKYEKTLCQRSADERNEYRLTFRHFGDEFNTFPLRLRLYSPPKPLTEDATATLPSLLLRFRQATFYEPWIEHWRDCQRSAEGRPAALIIPRKGIPNGILLHDGEGLMKAMPGAGLVYNHPAPDTEYGPEPPRTFIIPFKRALESIFRQGRGWTVGD